MGNKLQQAALAYAEKFGWAVFPLVPRDKTPLTENGYKDASTDPETIRAWWIRWPNANIGIACGASGLVVIDLDTKGDKDGRESWRMLKLVNHVDDDTVISLTGGGGQHLVFAANGHDFRNSAGLLGPGIDVRADGGYIIAPPSIHPNGREYAWDVGAHPKDREPSPLPQVLADLLAAVTPKTATPLPDRIPQGQRNSTLTSLAGSMRRRGASEAAILAALEKENTRCDPPLAEGELRGIAQSVARYTPTSADIPTAAGPAASDVHLTDMGNATRLAALHGDDLRYCHPWHKWLTWDGQRWAVDNTAYVIMLAKDAVREMYLEASQIHDDKERERLVRHALHSESKERIKAMLELCQSEPSIPVLPEHLDCDPWLLNCRNGTVDLRTGELLEHDKENLITKLCPVRYDPNAQHDLWNRFLQDATGGDQELQDFLQIAVGYSLTGITSEEKLFFVHGPTAAGKSTFIEAIKATLGDYAMTADFETFLVRRVTGGPRTDIARLAGARFVASVEVDEGKRLAEGLLKTLTGGDTVTTRFLYSNEFEFPPAFKLWLAANHAPKVRDDDDATWRRILRVPFTHTVPKDKIDPTVKATLRKPDVVGPAILSWAVKGCLLWQRDGLGIPNVVTKATSDLRDEMNPLADFFTTCCVFGSKCWTSAQALRLAYETHAQENGERYLVRGREWGKRLKDVGCTQSRQTVGDKQVRGWSGIGLLDTKDRLDGNFPKVQAGTECIGESCKMPSNASNLSSDPVLEAEWARGGVVKETITLDDGSTMPF